MVNFIYMLFSLLICSYQIILDSINSSRDTGGGGGGGEQMQKPKIIKSDEKIQRSEENEQLVLSKLIGEDQEEEKLNIKQDESCVPIKIKNRKLKKVMKLCKKINKFCNLQIKSVQPRRKNFSKSIVSK